MIGLALRYNHRHDDDMTAPTMTLFESENVQQDREARPRRLLALAGLLQVVRQREGWSVEQAALHAGIGHMTWRRAEQGVGSRVRTYAQMDGLFQFPLGTINQATNDDQLMLDLARKLGVAVPAGTDASTWVAEYARGAAGSTSAGRAVEVREVTGIGQASLGGLQAHAAGPVGSISTTDVAAVADVLERIRAWGPTATNVEAIKALTDALQNHLIDPSQHTVTTTHRTDGSWSVQVEPKDPATASNETAPA